MTMLERLSAPFPQSNVHWRVQGKPTNRDGKWVAMALAYIDARDVMDRLDEVAGPENWQTEYDETAKGRLICRLSIRINGEWITKSDGAGDTDVEGEKGAISDALKRAAVSWGIGRYLYRLSSPWIECNVSQKGDNVYWKSWVGDPWAKVKGAPIAPKPPATKPAPVSDGPTPAEIAHEKAVTNALVGIDGCADLPALSALWPTLPRPVQADARVIAAKDARKAQLTPKEQAA